MSDDDEHPGLRVISGGGAGDLPPVRRARRSPLCVHTKSEVDAQARRVYCATCSVELDPYDVLAKLAREGERFARLREEHRRLETSLADLQRRERNAKARTARAERRNG